MEININKRGLLLVIGSFLLPVALQIALLVYQYNKVKVITLWSIVATAVLIVIFLNAIRMNIWSKKKGDIETGENAQTVQSEKTTKRSRKTIAIFAVIMMALFGLSALFFNIHSNKVSGLQVVNSEVIWQEGKVVTSTKVEGNEITETEYREIKVLVKYLFNGQERTAMLKGNTVDKINVSELKLYVDESGTCVTDYGRILIWKIVAIICLCCAVLTLLVLVLKLGSEFFAGGLMCSIGLVLMFLVGCQFMENMWFNDLVCFTATFANAGLSILVYGVLNMILPKKEQEVVITILEKPVESEEIVSVPEKKTCVYCGSELLEGAKFCDKCGCKILNE